MQLTGAYMYIYFENVIKKTDTAYFYFALKKKKMSNINSLDLLSIIKYKK